MPPYLRPLLAAFALLPAAASAQNAPVAQDDIVVVARRDVDEEIAAFVDAFTAGAPRGQLPRFEHAICPTALGFSPALRAAIVMRQRKVAKAAGVEVAKPDCRSPNVLTIVTSDKKIFMAALARTYPHFRDDMSRSAWRTLSDSPEPAVAWHSAGPMRNADGFEMAVDRDTGIQVNPTTLGGSRIGFGSRPQFGTAIVIIEARALVGLTATQIADYAAMRTLIRTDPGRLNATAAPTILKILDAPMGSTVPPSLTDWDLGALRGFYAASFNTTAAAQGSDIRTRLKKEIATGSAPK